MQCPNYNTIHKTIKEALKTKILVLDGAMGTALQNENLTAQDFGGNDLEGCNENLVLTRPDIVSKIHHAYLEAGCDIIETNTFGATPVVLDEYQIGTRAFQINLIAAKLAREAANLYSTPDKPRFVAGSIGPTTKAISVTGGITFDGLISNFELQATALIQGKVDYLLIETCQDTRNIKAALIACQNAFTKTGITLPIAVSVTIEAMGTMLAGQGVEALLASVEHTELLYIGLNCATGPEFMTDHIRTLAKYSAYPIACVPNAGLPDENGCYLETPLMVTQILQRFLEKGWLNLVGGCCGTHAGHIHSLCELASNHKPRTAVIEKRSILTGIDALEITSEMRPVIVGERTNVIGSKKFKTLICEDKFDEASDIARAQIKNGAQIIDICLANPDRDEMSDIKNFLEFAVKKIRAPIMIDSTDDKVIEVALTYCQGKAIINSINLEDGEERFEKVIPLVKKYGAAVVVGTIDDDPKIGMGITRQRKLEIAKRSYDLLTGKYGIPETDIYWDPLVFPCATGDAQYVGSALETIEGVRLIKIAFPNTKTVLGVSNVSFGLPTHGREVLNSVFLYHCVKAGLDLAIVNSEKLIRFASISKEEIELSENLLFNKGDDPIAKFAAFYRTKVPNQSNATRIKLPLNERISRYIIEGSKDGLRKDLDLALQNLRPLEIINGPLMKGMDEVGRLFNSNQLIVAEVLQSAESMKAAVAHLEPHMLKTETSSRGKVLLATVKGDVHDIGKNLVEIILSNNGFNVINLGIKVPPEQLILAAKEHKPDIIGLSGLLVKSAQQMVITADDFSKAGIFTPVLVGGAALSEGFVDRHISKAYEGGFVAYANDAMHGLELAKNIVDKDKFELLRAEITERRSLKPVELVKTVRQADPGIERSPEISEINTCPVPQDYNRHVIRNTPYDQVFRFINPLMIYGRHLGIKGGIVRKLVQAQSDPSLRRELLKTEPKAVSIFDAVAEVKEEYQSSGVLAISAVFQFFKASSNKNQIMLYSDANQNAPSHSLLSNPVLSKPLMTFDFQRQCTSPYLSLCDYVSRDLALNDNIALFTVTCGRGIRALAEQLKNRGDYLKSHIIQVMALESAEAYAEYLHSQIRKYWGFPDLSETTMLDRFQAKYTGKRFSFGYPACPRLDDQEKLFKLLNPAEIGIQLTDGFMMDPEASVSAIVFHHPQAIYFSIGSSGDLNDDNRA